MGMVEGMKLLTKIAILLIMSGIIACTAATFKMTEVAFTFLMLSILLSGVAFSVWIDEREVR